MPGISIAGDFEREAGLYGGDVFGVPLYGVTEDDRCDPGGGGDLRRGVEAAAWGGDEHGA